MKKDANAGYNPAQQTKSAVYNPAQRTKSTVTKEQIKQIHTLKGKLGWDDDFYRDVLAKYRVKSSKELSESKAAVLIAEMMRAEGTPRAQRRELYFAKHPKEKAASYLQKKVIKSIWNDVSYMEDAEKREEALNNFIANKTGKTLDEMTVGEASKIIVILKKMEENNEKRS